MSEMSLGELLEKAGLPLEKAKQIKLLLDRYDELARLERVYAKTNLAFRATTSELETIDIELAKHGEQ